MSKVFVVDSYYKPLDPVHPGWARLLLKQRKASVYRRFPFTIILKTVVDQPQVEPLRIKIDPGSQTTGIALVNDTSGEVVFAANLKHRGKAIKKGLDVVPARLKSRGVHMGRMSVKANGAFTIYTKRGKVTDIGKNYCQMLQHTDGYGYTYAKQTNASGQASPAPAPNKGTPVSFPIDKSKDPPTGGFDGTQDKS